MLIAACAASAMVLSIVDTLIFIFRVAVMHAADMLLLAVAAVLATTLQ